MNTQLTIYALADHSHLTEDVYQTGSHPRLWIHLTDDLGRTIVKTPVATVKEALSALRDHHCQDVEVSYNTDVTTTIYRLAHRIMEHFLPG